MRLKIGILVPNSTYIPSLARDIPKALTLALEENPTLAYELYVEAAGYNADPSVLTDKIQELLIKAQVDVIIAPLNGGMLRYIKHHFSGQQVPLLVNTLGEDVINCDGQDPYLLVNSCNLWQNSWLAGYWGAITYGKRACSIAALHEGGYGMGFAFALGLEAQGGQLAQAAVTHRASCTEDPSAMIEQMVATNPDFIMGLYSGKEAISFLEAYHRLGYQGQIPLIGLPLMVDDLLFAELGELALGIHSISAWQPDCDEAQPFVDKYQKKTGRPVHYYTLMAYETGLLLAKAIAACEQQHVPLIEALCSAEVIGPRGAIKFDPETREVQSAVYLCEVVKGNDGRLHNKMLQALTPPTLLAEQVVLARKKLAKQGWLNPYLIA